MKTKNLVFLLIAAMVLIVLAYYRAALDRLDARTRPSPGTAVFPELDINRVARLQLRQNGAAVTLRRAAGKWEVSEKFGYPANFQRLRELLTRLEDLKIGRPLHLDNALRRDLRLIRPDKKTPDADSGIHVEMFDEQQSPLAALTIGKSFHGKQDPGRQEIPFIWTGAQGRYIKTHAGDAFLVTENFTDISAEPDRWIERRFLDIPAHKLVALEWSGAVQDDISLTRGQPGESWKLDGESPEETPLDTQRIRNIISALNNLGFDGIADPATPPEKLGLGNREAVTLKAETDDGRIYAIAIAGKPAFDEEPLHAMRVFAEYDLPHPAPDQPDEDAAAMAEQVRQHTESTRRINEELGPWIYRIKSSAAEPLLITSRELLLPPPPPDAAENED